MLQSLAHGHCWMRICEFPLSPGLALLLLLLLLLLLVRIP